MAKIANVHVEWMPVDAPQVDQHELDMSHAHTPPVVGDVVGQRGTVVVLASATLLDAVDLLIMHDRTAAGIVGEDGSLLGVLTENDMALAYASGVPCGTPVHVWLESGYARAAPSELPELIVRPSTTLLEAAVRMRAHIESETACHHLVVCEEGGGFHGVLSSLDLARALCALRRVRGTTVSEVMKPRAELPWCSPSDNMREALRKMATVHQNCVLVTGDPFTGQQVLGVVTPRDALRAYAEHAPVDVELGHWLRGLQARWEPRQVSAGAPVAEAAAVMTAGFVHHLVAVAADAEVVGVVSSLDLARAINADEDLLLC